MHYRLYSIYSFSAVQCLHCKHLQKRRLRRPPRHSRTFRCQVILPSHIAKSLDLFWIQSLVYIDPFFPRLFSSEASVLLACAVQHPTLFYHCGQHLWPLETNVGCNELSVEIKRGNFGIAITLQVALTNVHLKQHSLRSADNEFLDQYHCRLLQI